MLVAKAKHVYDFRVQTFMVVVSAVILACATFVQGQDIKKGSSLAIFVAMSIWTVVNIVSLATQLSTGSTIVEIIVPLSQLFSTVTLLVIALVTRGRSARPVRWYRILSWSDGLAIICCAAGIAGWLLYNDPYVAIWGNVAANLSGLLPMLFNAWRNPAGVNTEYWALRGLSTAIAACAFLTPGANAAGLIPQLTGVGMALILLALYGLAQRIRAKQNLGALSY